AGVRACIPEFLYGGHPDGSVTSERQKERGSEGQRCCRASQTMGWAGLGHEAAAAREEKARTSFPNNLARPKENRPARESPRRGPWEERRQDRRGVHAHSEGEPRQGPPDWKPGPPFGIGEPLRQGATSGPG